MPRTNRNTLKEYFKRGSMPNQKHFYEWSIFPTTGSIKIRMMAYG